MHVVLTPSGAPTRVMLNRVKRAFLNVSPLSTKPLYDDIIASDLREILTIVRWYNLCLDIVKT